MNIHITINQRPHIFILLLVSSFLFGGSELKVINEQIQIYNTFGQLVKQNEASETTIIDITDLQAGVYIIRVKSNLQPVLTFIKQ